MTLKQEEENRITKKLEYENGQKEHSSYFQMQYSMG